MARRKKREGLTVKGGILSKKEKEFIEKNHLDLTAEEIGEHLNRSPEQVRKYKLEVIQKSGKRFNSDSGPPDAGLEYMPEYQTLKKQFSEDELIIFKHRYNQYIDQFHSDVTATERRDIFVLIEIEIMMNRNKRDQAKAEKELSDFQRELARVSRTNSGSEEDKKFILNLEQIIASIKDSRINYTKEYQNLAKQQNDISKSLKGHREQRIKQLENSNKSFIGYLKQLEDWDFRRQTGEEIEIFKLAMEQEQERLSQYHEFMDGEIDKPLLTPDTV